MRKRKIQLLILLLLVTLVICSCKKDDGKNSDAEKAKQIIREQQEELEKKEQEKDALLEEKSRIEKEYDELKLEVDRVRDSLDVLKREFKDANEELLEYQRVFGEYNLEDLKKISNAEQLEDWINRQKEKEELAKKEQEERRAQLKKEEEEKKKLEIEERTRAIEASKPTYETGITYEQIARMPDKYLNQKVKFVGKVTNFREQENWNTMILVVPNKGMYDGTRTIFCFYNPYLLDFRLIEGDSITIYGEFLGLSEVSKDHKIPQVRINILSLN